MGALVARLGGSHQEAGERELQVSSKEEEGLSPEPVPLEDDSEEHREVVISKGVRVLEQIEKAGELVLQKDSVYGAVVAMPQLARSANWNATFTALALRSLLLYLMNLAFQFFLAYMVYNSAYNLFRYAGKMHLCSFGARHSQCPGGQNCYGPGGTMYTPERLYSFDIWSTRNFVRDSLEQVFPDLRHQIQDKVDPGEYGLESLSCRLICAFIFCMVVMDDLASTVELVQLLIRLPNEGQSWIAYNYSEKVESTGRRGSVRKSEVKLMNDWREKDLVKFKVRGMPLGWKLFNLLFVVVPKLMIWKAVAFVGVYYLFETAEIMALIINTTALAFLLSLDELIQKFFAASSMQHVMQNLDGWRLQQREVERETDEETVSFVRNMPRCTLHNFLLVVPKQLISTVALLVLFALEYYHANCVAAEDGSMISTNIRKPHRTYHWWCMFINCKNFEGDLMWSMPNVSYAYAE